MPKKTNATQANPTVQELRKFARAQGLTRCVCAGFTKDGVVTVTTYGTTAADSALAASVGNHLKKFMYFPPKLCRSVSAKILKMRAELKQLRAENKRLASEPTLVGGCVP